MIRALALVALLAAAAHAGPLDGVARILDRAPVQLGVAQQAPVECLFAWWPPFTVDQPTAVCGRLEWTDRPDLAWLVNRLGYLVLSGGDRVPFSLVRAPDGAQWMTTAAEGPWGPWERVGDYTP